MNHMENSPKKIDRFRWIILQWIQIKTHFKHIWINATERETSPLIYQNRWKFKTIKNIHKNIHKKTSLIMYKHMTAKLPHLKITIWMKRICGIQAKLVKHRLPQQETKWKLPNNLEMCTIYERIKAASISTYSKFNRDFAV